MDDFIYDVFLSHSSKDKEVVRKIAEQLRADEVRVWFDDWELRPGDSIPAKIEEGLEHSRVLVLCMSAHAFGSDWAQLEAGTFRFRDPLNRDRRFIPLRLDDVPIKGSLAQFLYINWSPHDCEQEYAKLLQACWPPAKEVVEPEAAHDHIAEKAIQLDYKEADIWSFAFGPDGKQVLTAGEDGTVRLWDVMTGSCIRIFEEQDSSVVTVAWDADKKRAITSTWHDEKTLKLWDVETGSCLQIFEYGENVESVEWSPDQRHALSGADDKTVRLWDVEMGRCLRVFEGHTEDVNSVAWSPDQRHALSGADDKTVRLWEVETGRCLRVLEGHTDAVWSIAWSPDQRHALSGADDMTIRLWDVESGRCLRVLKGHTDGVYSVAWSPDQRHVLSSAADSCLRLWSVETGRCLRVLEGHTGEVMTVTWSADGRRAFSGDREGGIRVWDLLEFVNKASAPEAPATALPPELYQIQYTNAKVLLVGESGAGKTGLSRRLALNGWQPSDSTVGAWATHWPLPVDSDDGIEREIWLWDFGGQADQRLIHQLYMDETSLAVLVFDGQKEDLFQTLGQWDRDLARASRKEFAKLLVAGRVDAGGLRCSPEKIEAFGEERGYPRFLETSAKVGTGCEELKQAILDGICW